MIGGTGECEIRVIQEVKGGKIIMHRNKNKTSSEDADAQDDASNRIVYKVPLGTLQTINFTTNPFEIERLHRRRERKRLKSPTLRARKSKKQRLSEIPKSKNCVISPTVLNEMGKNILKRRVEDMKQKYEIGDFVYSTEDVLVYDASLDVNKHLDYIKDIDDELCKYLQYQVRKKWLMCRNILKNASKIRRSESEARQARSGTSTRTVKSSDDRRHQHEPHLNSTTHSPPNLSAASASSTAR